MKKFTLLLTLIALTLSLFSTDYYVGNQAGDISLSTALASALYDTDNIILRDSNTEYTLTAGTHYLYANLKSLSNNPHACTINLNNSNGLIVSNSGINILIKGLTIKGLNYNLPTYNALSAFYITGTNVTINMDNNIFKNNNGKYSGVIASISLANCINLSNNIFYKNTGIENELYEYASVLLIKGIDNTLNIKNNIFYRNVSTSTGPYYRTIRSCGTINPQHHIEISNNTFVNEVEPISIYYRNPNINNSNVVISKNIFYDNDNPFRFTQYSGNVSINNNCFYNNLSIQNQNFPMINSKLTDPKFLNPYPNAETDPYFYKYFALYEGSECIDGSNMITSTTDLDEGRDDIGYRFPTTYDTKVLYSTNRWSWICFQRLNRNTNINTTANILSYLNSAHLGTVPSTMTLNDYQNTTNYSTSGWTLSPFNKNSAQMVKINISDLTAHNYTSIWNTTITEKRVSPSTTFTLQANTDNWVGYFLPNNQNIDVAFGANFDKIESIKSEKWTYIPMISNTKDEVPFVPSNTIRPLEYGRGYIIRVKETISNFQWVDSGASVPVYSAPDTRSFAYNALPDYEVIDIMGIDDNSKRSIEEIGVYENDECIGAVVVDQFPVQLLAYTGSANADLSQLSFRVIYKGEKSVTNVSDCQIYNQKTNVYESNSLYPGFAYAQVRLNNANSNINPVTHAYLKQNYPNPFNPSTCIDFYLPQSANIKLAIYNIKGQLIKTLANGTFPAGNQNFVWNGIDNQGNKVSSGVYMYKLITDHEVISKKMLLIK